MATPTTATSRSASTASRRVSIDAAVTDLCAALFPQRLGEAHGEEDEDNYVADVLDRALRTLLGEVRLELRYWDDGNSVAFEEDDAEAILRHFTASLPADPPARQPTTRRENRSMTTATYSHPSAVQM